MHRYRYRSARRRYDGAVRGAVSVVALVVSACGGAYGPPLPGATAHVLSGTVTVAETSEARPTLLIRSGSTLVVVPSSPGDSTAIPWTVPTSSNQGILAAAVRASTTSGVATDFTAVGHGDVVLAGPVPYNTTMGLHQRAVVGQPQRFQYVTASGPEFVLFVRVEP